MSPAQPELPAGGHKEPPAPHIPGRAPHRMTPAYRALASIAALLILLMIVVTCVDVVGRYIFNRPFAGAFELTQLLLGALVFTALPLTGADGGHVEVDLALHLLPPPVQRLLGRIAGVIAGVALAYFAWRLTKIGIQQLGTGQRTSSLAIPMAPLAFLAAASCAVSAVISVLRRPE
ncbi:MAG: TRAP transporter small permease [Paracoccus sp. (in: a-proteobacteria)]|nr:TRAP transporter small permease [Paracoccus sp. (in: a-proteobacteria)]